MEDSVNPSPYFLQLKHNTTIDKSSIVSEETPSKLVLEYFIWAHLMMTKQKPFDLLSSEEYSTLLSNAKTVQVNLRNTTMLDTSKDGSKKDIENCWQLLLDMYQFFKKDHYLFYFSIVTNLDVSQAAYTKENNERGESVEERFGKDCEKEIIDMIHKADFFTLFRLEELFYLLFDKKLTILEKKPFRDIPPMTLTYSKNNVFFCHMLLQIIKTILNYSFLPKEDHPKPSDIILDRNLLQYEVLRSGMDFKFGLDSKELYRLFQSSSIQLNKVESGLKTENEFNSRFKELLQVVNDIIIEIKEAVKKIIAKQSSNKTLLKFYEELIIIPTIELLNDLFRNTGGDVYKKQNRDFCEFLSQNWLSHSDPSYPIILIDQAGVIVFPPLPIQKYFDQFGGFNKTCFLMMIFLKRSPNTLNRLTIDDIIHLVDKLDPMLFPNSMIEIMIREGNTMRNIVGKQEVNYFRLSDIQTSTNDHHSFFSSLQTCSSPQIESSLVFMSSYHLFESVARVYQSYVPRIAKKNISSFLTYLNKQSKSSLRLNLYKMCLCSILSDTIPDFHFLFKNNFDLCITEISNYVEDLPELGGDISTEQLHNLELVMNLFSKELLVLMIRHGREGYLFNLHTAIWKIYSPLFKRIPPEKRDQFFEIYFHYTHRLVALKNYSKGTINPKNVEYFQRLLCEKCGCTLRAVDHQVECCQACGEYNFAFPYSISIDRSELPRPGFFLGIYTNLIRIRIELDDNQEDDMNQSDLHRFVMSKLADLIC